VKTRQNIERFGSSPFVPFTQDPREEELLREAGAWLLPRLGQFERLPRQIIHGDWTPQNVLFESSDRGTRLTAVLDFEAMSNDPIHVDLANSCSTMLMWSGLDRNGPRIADIQKSYESFAGLQLEREPIYTAMLAHWVCHYWNWRDRLKFGEFGQEVKDRLCLRIASVLQYVCGLTVDAM
jgi:Ser/Thr protein kinase RdoA (MazF antagonist)